MKDHLIREHKFAPMRCIEEEAKLASMKHSLLHDVFSGTKL